MYTRPDLRHALEADIPEIDKAVNRNPELAFEQFSTNDVNDESINMSMIEYAVYVGDYDVFQTLLRAASQTNSLEKFLLQSYPVSKRTKFNMNRYYQTCAEFVSKFNEAGKNKNSDELQAAYHAVVLEQSKIPRHILYEMCGHVIALNVIGYWRLHSDFKRSVSRDHKAEFRIFKDGYQYSYGTLPQIRPTQIHSKYILGKDGVLTRGYSESTDFLQCGHGQLTGERIQEDVDIIKHLLIIRHAQIADHIERLIIEHKLEEAGFFDKLDAMDQAAIKKLSE